MNQSLNNMGNKTIIFQFYSHYYSRPSDLLKRIYDTLERYSKIKSMDDYFGTEIFKVENTNEITIGDIIHGSDKIDQTHEYFLNEIELSSFDIISQDILKSIKEYDSVRIQLKHVI